MSSSTEGDDALETGTVSASTAGQPDVTNEAYDVDLRHSEEDHETIVDILEGSNLEEGHEFSTEETHEFSRASGDDQGVHDNLNPRTMHNFHSETAGIMADNPEAYQGGEVDRSKIDGRERFIVQGALATSMLIADIDELVKRNPESISAMHNRPVKHHPRGSHEATVDQDLNVLVDEYDIPAATHEVLEYDEEADIDYAGNMYALSKGMGFEDRNGDVLLGFLEINMTEYDFEGLEELYLGERTLVEDGEGLEFHEGGIPDAEAMNLDHIGDVNAYRNSLVDQDGEEVIEYVELDLQGVGYEEEGDSHLRMMNAYTDLWTSMVQNGMDLMTP